MKPNSFFIDTADTDYINNLWDNFLKNNIDGKSIAGVTTNPNAIAKINVNDLDSFTATVKKLCTTVSTIRGDDQGAVYVQHPDSNVTVSELKSWIDYLLHLATDCKIGLKIPPYFDLLNLIPKYSNIIDFNVTGVADCSTALYCIGYSPRYVSVIPGRMEEVGINASNHLQFLDQRYKNKYTEIITGSMRTIDGLQKAIYYNTVPTIGTRVFDLFTNPEQFIELWDSKNESYNIKFSPNVTESSKILSLEFFDQMNNQGRYLNKKL